MLAVLKHSNIVLVSLWLITLKRGMSAALQTEQDVFWAEYLTQREVCPLGQTGSIHQTNSSLHSELPFDDVVWLCAPWFRPRTATSGSGEVTQRKLVDPYFTGLIFPGGDRGTIPGIVKL